jgi:hypothetical protein
MGRDREFGYYYNNRTLCEVLEEMRKLDKAKNYSGLAGLIEEAQSMGNRMEAGLSDSKDLLKLSKDTSKARKLFKKEKKRYEKMKKKADSLKSKAKSS